MTSATSDFARNTDAHLTRTEAVREACLRLVRQVREVCPAGLGHWPAAWDLVAEASSAFLAATEAWEASGTPEMLTAAKVAGRDVLGAWRGAAAAWKAAGCPVGREVAHA